MNRTLGESELPYKILTHDYRPPIRGGEPVCDGGVPVDLLKVALDTSDVECGAGWNYCSDIETALGIAGLWPNGWSALVLGVAPGTDAIVRGKKCRASTLTLTGLASDGLVRDAIERFSIPFGTFNDAMATEQWLWFEALRRPLRDPAVIEAGLTEALNARDLKWSLKRFDSARDAWDAWDARAARDAWDALTVNYAAYNGWINHPADLLSTGLRDAYKHGLAIAIPTGPNELGWAMVRDDERHPAVTRSGCEDSGR